MKERLDETKARMANACQLAGRDPQEVTIVAVSKKQTVESIRQLYDLGVRDFGENYLQEWLEKKPHLPDDIRWHFIGDVQSRKIKDIAHAQAFMVHSLDRDSQVQQWQKVPPESRPKLLLQVNVSGEDTKSGIDLQDIEQWFKRIAHSDLTIDGLMTFPPPQQNPEFNRGYFAQLRELQTWICEQDHPKWPCQELSMGISNDFEIAIEEGATLVRVGTQIFGPRPT